MEKDSMGMKAKVSILLAAVKPAAKSLPKPLISACMMSMPTANWHSCIAEGMPRRITCPSRR